MFYDATDTDFDDIIHRYGVKGYDNVYKPAFGRGSIHDLPNLFKKTLGMSSYDSIPNIMNDSSEEVEHLIFFLLDGFGHSTLKYAMDNFTMPNLRTFLRDSIYVPITSVFPSTTSTATVSIQTGLQPIEHGIVGYTSYISEVGAICNMISLAPLENKNLSLLDNEREIFSFSESNTIYSEMNLDGISSFLYLPNNIKNSGMTRITGRGATVHGYYSIPQMFTKLRKDIENSDGRSFHFCYVSSIDTISHNIGPYTEETAYDIDSIFYQMERQLIEDLRPEHNTKIIISADHGHIEIPNQNLFDATNDNLLRSYLSMPILGDFRAPILRIKNGKIGEAYEYIQNTYGRDYIVKLASEMLSEGYFGSSNKVNKNSDRFGDIILVPKKNVGISDSYLKMLDPKSDGSKLVGMHGGLSFEEMIVPFISMNIEGGRKR